jgi:arsenite methyltransferase
VFQFRNGDLPCWVMHWSHAHPLTGHRVRHAAWDVGRIGGAIMARGNADQEQRATDRAALRAGENVVVIGHGPGVGLELAAKAVSPSGHVVGVEPSKIMRDMAAARCETEIKAGIVELRASTADQTGCADNSMDAAISVNLRPGGRLVIFVHRHVLPVTAAELSAEAAAAGFTDLAVSERDRRFNSPAVELTGLASNTT